jgi:hypothetical protein
MHLYRLQHHLFGFKMLLGQQAHKQLISNASTLPYSWLGSQPAPVAR